MAEFENKNEINWIDLDDSVYNNHFSNGQCYMKVEFNRNSGIESTYMINLPIYPEDVTFNGSTNYQSAEILGRPGTIAGYVNTSDVTSNFSFHLHRELQVFGDLTKDSTIMRQDKNKVDNIVTLIEAAAYPKKFQDGIGVPIVTYKFGGTIITGKQVSWNVKWSGPKIGNIYMDCTVNVSVTHVPLGIQFFENVLSTNPYEFE